jgi:CheY-like chemotaxis protein
MDINMPQIDGIQATSYLNSLYGNTLKIIMLTAFDDILERKKSQQAGAIGFLNKPLNLKNFLEFLYEPSQID